MSVRSTSVVVSLQAGVPIHRGRQVTRWLEQVGPQLVRDIGVHRGALHIRIYGTHRGFSAALWTLQHRRPQGPTDNTGGIVGSTLLLGPEDPTYLRHNLTHIYAEWLLDALTGNRTDNLPSHTWLYDGIAEYEALRYAPDGMHCASRGDAILTVTQITTARRWLRLRAGPLGPMEYCLAALEVGKIVHAAGWQCLMASLRHRGLRNTAIIVETHGTHGSGISGAHRLHATAGC